MGDRPDRDRCRETRANSLARSHVALCPVRQWVPQLAFAFSVMSRSSADWDAILALQGEFATGYLDVTIKALVGISLVT